MDAINNHGRIVGSGLFNGIEQAVLLTPVPVPASALLLACGALSLALLRRRST